MAARGFYSYTESMNKTVLLIAATIGGLIGGYVPMLFGDTNMFDGWSVLGGLIGGLAGIWLGVVISKQLG